MQEGGGEFPDVKTPGGSADGKDVPAGGFSVFAGVGERTREGNDLYKEMIEGVSPSSQSTSPKIEPSTGSLHCSDQRLGYSHATMAHVESLLRILWHQTQPGESPLEQSVVRGVGFASESSSL